MKKYLNFAVFGLLFILWIFCPQKISAQDAVRIRGLGPTSALALDGIDPSVLPPEPLPPELFAFFAASDLHDRWQDGDLFGENGICPCSVDVEGPLAHIDSGSLVDNKGKLLTDIFFVGQLIRSLDATEAHELKAFMEAGGVVHMAGGREDLPGFGYQALWQELGWAGSPYTQFYEQLPTEGNELVDLIVKSRELTNTPFEPGIFGTVEKINYLPIFFGVNTSNLEAQAMSGNPNSQPVMAGAEVGKGYLTVSGTPLFINFNNLAGDNNLKYFQNMAAWVCEGKPQKVQPFLALPWDYIGKGMSFNDAATAINSYFDHEYPLLSTRLPEPTFVLKYEGFPRTDDYYSSHDGYDYGKGLAKLNYLDPVLAAADGTASLRNNCDDCGNAIHIDHGNGYQTRYYHLADEGLIVPQPGQSVAVQQGQMIGKMGFTGNVKPDNINGSHIHFMVIHDKNEDGNFDDNIPDGVVDPYGWQSSEPDPWPSYSFSYHGQQKRGSRSHYLWTEPLLNLSSAFDSNAAFFEAERYKLSFPADSVNQEVALSVKAANHVSLKEDLLNSLETVFFPVSITISSLSGQPIISFPGGYEIEIDLKGLDFTRYIKDSLSFYSSQDGINWIKELTEFDWDKLSATTTVNHASYFALMGELADPTPPVTKITISGTESGSVYSGGVQINLSAEDNPGGSGIMFTAYRLNGNEWAEASSPIDVNTVGTYNIEYYSQDNEGNVEEVKSTAFEVIAQDTSPPEAKIQFDPDKHKTVITAIDASQVDITITEGKGLFGKDKVLLKDASGNTLAITGRLLFTKVIDTLSIETLQYNGGKIIRLGKNAFTTVATRHWRTNELTYLLQSWFDKGDTRLLIQYNPARKQSYIIKKDVGKKIYKETLPGMVLMHISTNNGNLEYSYE